MTDIPGPGPEPGSVADLCTKLIELTLVRFAGDPDVDRQEVDQESLGIADDLATFGPLPAIYLAGAYARLWIESCGQQGVDPLAAWQLRKTPEN